jgi:hypothetical protein
VAGGYSAGLERGRAHIDRRALRPQGNRQPGRVRLRLATLLVVSILLLVRIGPSEGNDEILLWDLRYPKATNPVWRSHVAKYRSLMPLLALIGHLIDGVAGGPTGPVSDGAAP